MGTLRLHFDGEGEGSFDINIGTKKQSLSVQDAIFLSISIILLQPNLLSLRTLFLFFHPPWFNHPHPPTPFREQSSLPTPFYPPPLHSALPPPQSLVAPPSSITLHG